MNLWDPLGLEINYEYESFYEYVLTERAKEYLSKSDRWLELEKNLEEAEEVITVDVTLDRNKVENAQYHGSNRGGLVEWNPGLALVTGDDEIISPAILLAHELGHAEQHLQGIIEIKNYSIIETFKIEDMNLQKTEWPISDELGEPKREHYLSTKGYIPVDDPNYHTNKIIWKFKNKSTKEEV